DQLGPELRVVGEPGRELAGQVQDPRAAAEEDAEEGAGALDLVDNLRVRLGEALQSGAQNPFQRARPGRVVVLDDDVHRLDGGGRLVTEGVVGGAVQDHGGEPVVRPTEDRLPGGVPGDGRLSAAQRLRVGENVGHQALIPHEVEQAAGLPPTGVDLVEDQ